LAIDRLKCQCIVEGPNFYFGRGRGGDVALLGSMCEDSGISLDIVEPTIVGDQMISSTRIRDLLLRGEIEQANELLGGFHQIFGTVVRGDQRGRTIGFPTANLSEIDVVVPAPGVYGGTAWTDSGGFATAIHIGPRPTFEESNFHGPRSTVEAHLLDYDGDLYGKTLAVDLLTRVGDIAQFDSAKDLACQLASDVKTVREQLASLHSIRP
jgi:riboflavin kinase/FMN adenylyltransferase